MLIGAAAGGVVSTLLGGATSPSTTALTDIPAGYLALYQQAAAVCPGLDWTILAAIGKVETDHGRSQLPGSQHGENASGAGGSMQFLEPTFTSVIGRHPIPSAGVNPPSRYNPHDAIYAAAYYLCDNGASRDPQKAIFAYYTGSTAMPTDDQTQSPAAKAGEAYVAQVLTVASSYRQPVPLDVTNAGTVAADWALTQVGTPYAWGGETPGTGFDCSGLTQAAYTAAGITLPRIAQAQFDAGPHLPADTTLQRGDLVFFGSGPADVTHVGLYLGTHNGEATMVDAPHQGADVRVESFPAAIGAAWGSDIYLGATRPAGV